jgi:hypothetical protein
VRGAVVIEQLELVLEPRQPIVGEPEDPASILAHEVALWQGQVGAQPDGCEALFRIVDVQAAEHGLRR